MVFTQRETKTAYKFIKDRVIRIYPAYIIYSTPIIIYAMLSSGYDHGISNVLQLIQNYTLIPGFSGASYTNANYPGWTLVYEMLFYVTFSVCLLFTRDKIKVTVFIFVIFISVLAISRNAFPISGGYQLTDIEFISGNMIIIDFIVGCALALIYKGRVGNISGKTFLISVVSIFVLSVIFISNFDIPEKRNLVSLLVSTLPASLVIYLAISSQRLNSPLLEKIGNASYSIYLTHVTLLILTRKIMDKLNLSDSIPMIVLGNAVFVIAAVVLGLFAYKIVEKPIVDRMKKKPSALGVKDKVNDLKLG